MENQERYENEQGFEVGGNMKLFGEGWSQSALDHEAATSLEEVIPL